MSEYYMLDSWGFDIDEPIQTPVDVDFDNWEDKYGIGEDQVDFSLGWSLSGIGIPSPIEMVWDKTLSNNDNYWKACSRPSEGLRSKTGIRRKWAYDACEPPLFHKDLVQALNECGIDNIEVFKVRLTDPETGDICDDYFAVNFVGLVQATDMMRSKATVHSDNGLIDTDFDEISLDKNLVKGHKIFRLAESVNALVIHQSVKEHLEYKGGFELDFTKPKDWIG